MFSREMFVWVDETGSNTRDHVRKYGYALWGMRPICHRLLCRGRRINAIAAITSSGILALETISDTVNGDLFFYYLRGSLIPNMSCKSKVNTHT